MDISNTCICRPYCQGSKEDNMPAFSVRSDAVSLHNRITPTLADNQLPNLSLQHQEDVSINWHLHSFAHTHMNTRMWIYESLTSASRCPIIILGIKAEPITYKLNEAKLHLIIAYFTMHVILSWHVCLRFFRETNINHETHRTVV